MALRIEPGDQPGLVRLIGELDISTGPDVVEALAEAGESHSNVVVDLSELTFMDSSGVRILLHAWSQQRDRGGELVLRSPTQTVQRLFELLDLEANGVRVEPSPSEA